MKVIIISDIPFLPIALGQELEKKGFTIQHALPRKSKSAVEEIQESALIRYGTGVNNERLSALEKALSPISCVPVTDTNLDQDEIQLQLKMPADLKTWELSLQSDSERMKDKLKGVFVDSFGFSEEESSVAVVEQNQLIFGSAPKQVRQLIRWFLKTEGIEVSENQKFSEDDNDIYLHIKDPQAAKLPPKERFKVHLATDDFKLAKEFSHKLTRKGFKIGEIASLDEEDLQKAPIGYGADWLEKGYFPAETKELRSLLSDFVLQKGVDKERYPVVPSDDLSAGIDAVVCLPLRACLGSTRRPYAGPFAERFEVTIYTDEGETVTSLESRLRAAGFEEICFEKIDADDRLKGFQVKCKKDEVDPEIFGLVRETVVKQMEDDGVDPDFQLDADQKDILALMCGDDEIRVYYPRQGALDGSLIEDRHSPKNWECMLQCEDPGQWEDARKSLESWGFKTLTINDSAESFSRLDYGGAPTPLLERLQSHFKERYDLTLGLNKKWGGNDDDIYIYLPRKEKLDGVSVLSSVDEDWFRLPTVHDCAEGSEPFLAQYEDKLKIGELELPVAVGKRHPLAPALEQFSHFCVDAKTAETLHHLAMSLLLGEPCLLEGETSTSKTSSILYLAALQNAPLLRMNLNGQTDSSEMIGRFIPVAGKGGKTGWQWQDGLLPQAMKNGFRLLYDEYNLGAPEIRERDNSAREYPPSLTLSEYDNSVIGSVEQPVHDDFHLFATMNPAEYVGRQPMSPADRDRWRSFRFVPSPGEEEYAQMLMFLATGQQPDLNMGGTFYRGNKQEAQIPQLAEIPELEKIVKVVAGMHAALERAARSEDGGLDASRKDAFIVTRRGLISLMLYLAYQSKQQKGPLIEIHLRQALFRYYLARATSPEERDAVMGIFDASGLGPHSWCL